MRKLSHWIGTLFYGVVLGVVLMEALPLRVAAQPANPENYLHYYASDFALLSSADSLLAQGKANQALEVLNYLTPNDSAYRLAQYLQAEAYLMDGDAVSCQHLCKELINGISPLGHEAALLRLDAQLASGDTARAIAALQAAMERYPLSYPLRREWGYLLSQQGRQDSALAVFHHNLKQYPNDWFSHAAVGEIALAQGRLLLAGFAFQAGILVCDDAAATGELLLRMEQAATAWEAGNGILLKANGEPLRLTVLGAGKALPSVPSSAYKLPGDVRTPAFAQKLLAVAGQEAYGTAEVGPLLAWYGKKTQWLADSTPRTPLYFNLLSGYAHRRSLRFFFEEAEALEQQRRQFADWLNSTAEPVPIPLRALPDSALQLPCSYDSAGFPLTAGNIAEGKRVGPWLFFHPNFEPAAMGNFDRYGNRSGPWFYFDSTGTLTNLENYYYGQLQGSVKTFYPNGALRQHYQAQADYLHGPVLEFYANGGLKAEYAMEDDQLHGPFSSYYPNGRPKRIAQFANGAQVGKETYFHPNGNPQMVAYYSKDQLEGAFRSFYPDSTLQAKGQYRDNLRHGTWQWFNPQGRLVQETEFFQGVPHGRHREYHPRGTERLTASYELGLANGLTIERDTLGRVKARFLFKQGQLMKYSLWSPDGEEYASSNVGDGTFRYRRTRPNGELIESGQQLDGRQEGTWKTYYIDGALHEKLHYAYGVQQGWQQTFYPDSTLKAKTRYEGDVQHGLSYTYYPEGSLQSIARYENGQQVDHAFEFWPNGELKSWEFYQNDSLAGWNYYYDTEGRTLQTIIHSDTGSTYLFHAPLQPGKAFRAWGYAEQQLYRLSYAGDTLLKGQLEAGWRQGTWQHYATSPTGRETIVEEHYRNGYLHGSLQHYHPGGTPALAGQFAFGEADSLWKWFRPDGTLAQMGYFRAGLQHGRWVVLDPLGNVRHEQRFRQGELNGVQTWRDANGDVICKILFRNGQLQAPAKGTEYQLDTLFETSDKRLGIRVRKGKKTCALFSLRAGYFHGEQRFFNVADSNLAESIYFHFGNLHGTQETFGPTGKRLEKREWWYGDPHGQWESYSAEGELLLREEYQFGLKEGKQEYFHPGDDFPYLELQYVSDLPIRIRKN